MKKILSLFIAVICLTAGNLTAQISVNVTEAGGLGRAVRAQQPDPAQVTNLTVTGTIDARDFRFIRDTLTTTLASLDLSGVTIAAYSGLLGTNCVPNTGADVQTTYTANKIPQMALGKRWTTGPIFRPVVNYVKMTALQTLVLPASTTEIGDYALAYIPASQINLQNMSGLTVIGNNVFTETGIISMNFPEGLQTIGTNTFAGCVNLTSVSYPTTLLSIGGNHFNGCIQLSSATFAEPSSITTLPFRFLYSQQGDTETFYLPDLLTFTVPSSVTDVTTAFENFIGTAIECHPDNETYYSIDGVLYRHADNSIVALPKLISSFTVPATMTVIPDRMFQYCTNLTTVTVESQLTKIGNNAFQYSGITGFNFPNTLVEIGEYAFSSSHLTNVNMTDNAALQTIGTSAFANIETLTAVNLTGLDTLGSSMFMACTALTGVSLSTDLSAIPTSAFSGCSALQTVTVPEGVKTIGSNAFMSCGTLTSINFPSTLENIDIMAFANDTMLNTFAIPASLSNFTVNDSWGGTPFNNTYAAVTVDAANPYFAAENGILFNKNKNMVLHVPMTRTRQHLIIPENVDTVGNSALRSSSKYYKITLPASLKHIAAYGLYASAQADTIVVKSLTPPTLGNAANSLNNSNYPYAAVVIPAQTKPAYIAAAGWANCYNATDNRDEFVMMPAFKAMGNGIVNKVSPNGKYAAGHDANGGYVYNLGTGDYTYITNAANVTDVNDKGWASIDFLDYNYQVDGTPLRTGGVYRNGQIYSIGLARHGATPSTAELNLPVRAIDSVGNVYGQTFNTLNSTVLKYVTPFAWKYNEANDNYTTDTMAFASPAIFMPNDDQGASILDISSNGQVAAGWASRRNYNSARVAIGWTSPTEYQLFSENFYGETLGVSPNGKYITTYVNEGGYAAVYDVENDILTVFGPKGSRGLAVSDNGFIVGYHEYNGGRQAFIWSERLGFMYFREFFERYLPDLELPSEAYYQFPSNGGIFDVPMGISADGLTISGWSGYGATAQFGWIIQIPEELDLIDRPHNLTASVDVAQRNQVALAWDAPTDYGSHYLDYYYIYRDGVKIDSIEPHEGTAFVDDAPAGRLVYNVSAVFDYNEDRLESGLTDPAYATVIDSYGIPFAENFESGTSFATNMNFWQYTEPTSGAAWVQLNDVGRSFTGMQSAFFVNRGNQEPYNTSLTSKPLNAAGHDKVILAYVSRFVTGAATILGIRDTVYTEVGVNDVWTKVATYVFNGTEKFAPHTVDISSVAANSLFRVRFRAVSGANRIQHNFVVDNFGVDFEETTVAPEGTLAYRYEDEAVNVLYKDVAGSYGLTYTDGKMMQSIGRGVANEPIIAVNRYTWKELKPLKDKYLSSVSAILSMDFAGTTPSELKLAVFVNGTRVESSPITNWKGEGSWENFPLLQPVKVNENDEILVGIEAISTDSVNRPIGIDGDSVRTNVNGNLYSEDNGQTWDPASIANIWGNWMITANFRDEASAPEIDDDLYDALYLVYKNDVLVDTLVIGQRYVDKNGTDDDCYKIQVFRSLGGMSPVSQTEGCVDIYSSVNEIEIVSLNVYPNPATDFVHVSDDFAVMNIYDEVGRLVLSTADRDISVRGWAKGMYLFQTTLTSGKIAISKIIVK